jgi:putative protein-disulfide isomerase
MEENSSMQDTLYYVHDPMCSWCWGFEPTRARLFAALDGRITITRLVGGLAPDSDEPMPDAMRQGLQQTWRRIQQMIPGTEFNFAFWTDCAPRRSTYPADRAVIAARMQSDDFDQPMTARIQRAYYLEARNPSDNETLIALAADIGLDVECFASDLVDTTTQQKLLAEILTARRLGIDSFPSLAVASAGNLTHIGLNYTDAEAMLDQIEGLIG